MSVMPQQILIWCCCLLLVQLVSALTGDNVCKRVETSSETIDYVVTEPVTFRMYTWCLKMPPRCSKYTTIMKERLKTKLQVNNHTIDYCCDGYAQLETYCVPECNRSECPNMRCTADKMCTCEAGFHGQRCHMPCRLGYWGENCLQKCICNGEPCNSVNGDCLPQTSTTTTRTTKSLTLEVLEAAVELPTTPINNLNQISPTTSTFSTQEINHVATKKTELSEDVLQEEYADLDATVIPDGMSWDDIRTTLLPEDQVMIVYPSVKPKPKTTKTVDVEKATRKPITIPIRVTHKYLLPSEIVTKVPYHTEKYKKSTPSKSVYELNAEFPRTATTMEHTQLFDTVTAVKSIITNDFKSVSSKKHPATTATTSNKHNRYHVDSSLNRKGNGLPPPVPDGSDNSLRLKNGDHANINKTFSQQIDNQNIIKFNELQRDTGGNIANNDNYSKANTEATINSSLVRAKWNSALDAIDFNSPSIIISTTVTIILSLVLIVVIIMHFTKRSKIQSTSFYDDNVKACHDNGLVCSGHYTSPGGQPVFFCPAFTNSYAFELAQELREAHYDHPRSARCLSNEPVYAELQY